MNYISFLWVLILFIPTIAISVIVFIAPFTDKKFAPDYGTFWNAFVRLKRFPTKGGWNYVRLTNIVSLFFIWGYAMYLAGYTIWLTGKTILWVFPFLRNYLVYVRDLFKTN